MDDDKNTALPPVDCRESRIGVLLTPVRFGLLFFFLLRLIPFSNRGRFFVAIYVVFLLRLIPFSIEEIRLLAFFFVPVGGWVDGDDGWMGISLVFDFIRFVYVARPNVLPEAFFCLACVFLHSFYALFLFSPRRALCANNNTINTTAAADGLLYGWLCFFLPSEY